MKSKILALRALKCSASSLQPLSAVGFESEPFTYSYSSRDVVLYALSVGVSTAHKNGLRLLFEGHPAFGALPSFGVIPAFGCLVGLVSGGVPGLNVDLAKVATLYSLMRSTI